MRLKLSNAAWLLALLLVGCSTLGVPPADTFNKRVVVANGLVESASKTVESLYVAGKVTKDEATKYNQQTREAAAAIDIAREVHSTDPTAADARLAGIIKGLEALTAYLETRK